MTERTISMLLCGVIALGAWLVALRWAENRDDAEAATARLYLDAELAGARRLSVMIADAKTAGKIGRERA